MLRSVGFPSRSTSLPTDSAGTASPDAFGPFRVLHQIGAGALGPVFRAYDPEQEKLVAVKWFRLDLPPERTHRLVAELEQLIAPDLSHRAIATPLATGIVNAAAYLAHDFVTADSVDIVIRERGSASPAETARIATHLAGALDAAADAKIVHGALHPRDVLVSADDVRLTGLGIARALERAGAAAPTRRPYTAPERVAGTATWDRRADVFSLAVLVHEWLWAKRVTGLGRQAADALTELPGADLAALRRLFMRALADNPDDRFDTARQFAEELTHALAAGSSPKSRAPSRRPLAGPRLPLEGSMESARPGDAVKQPGTAGEEPSEPHDLAELTIQPPQNGPSDLEIGTADVSADSDLLIAPVTARAVRRVPASDPAFRSTGALSQTDQDHRGRSHEDRAPFENGNGAFDPARSAVWPIGLALVLGISLGFAAGYEVASWQRRPGAAPAAAAGPAPDAQATSGSSGREFTDSAVREPAAAATAATPGTGVSLTPKAEAAPPAGARPATPAAAGRLLIRSTPAGARVVVDGRDVGETPVTVRDVARGAHTVRVARDGYVPGQRRVVVSAASPQQSLTIALTPARPAAAAPSTPSRPGQSVAALNVMSRPAGANVFLDGKLIGRTPLQVDEVAAGDHAVRIELDGYRRWSSSVHVVAGERGRVAASLER